jgi:hypothetical protein
MNQRFAVMNRRKRRMNPQLTFPDFPSRYFIKHKFFPERIGKYKNHNDIEFGPLVAPANPSGVCKAGYRHDSISVEFFPSVEVHAFN